MNHLKSEIMKSENINSMNSQIPENNPGTESLDSSRSPPIFVLASNSMSRFDHVINQLQVLHQYRSLDIIYLIDTNDETIFISALVENTKNLLKFDDLKTTCSIFALDLTGATAVTNGLAWELDESLSLGFGAIQSTSNHNVEHDV